MARVGIIAEFNPLHSGHEFLINEAKKSGEVVCAVSGNFVQRGDCAISSKEIRARSALISGADLVCEIPVLWSMSTAQNFALGGVSALAALGCDTVVFGSEAGDTKPLIEICDILESDKFSDLLGKYMKNGTTFALARQKACEELGAEKGILDKPNNNLGIEYISASRRLGLNMNFKTVKRMGADHDSTVVDTFVSASLLREKLLSGDREFCSRYMKDDVLDLYKDGNIADIKRLEKGILAVLKLKGLNDLKKLPDLSEGVENKLFSAIKTATSLENLYNGIKVKRYTMSRVRRLVLSAFLGFDDDFFMKPLPYVRVLGRNKTGEKIVKSAKKTSAVPIIMRVGEINKLPDSAKKVFEIEAKATDLYNLSLSIPQSSGKEYTFKLLTEE